MGQPGVAAHPASLVEDHINQVAHFARVGLADLIQHQHGVGMSGGGQFKPNFGAVPVVPQVFGLAPDRQPPILRGGFAGGAGAHEMKPARRDVQQRQQRGGECATHRENRQVIGFDDLGNPVAPAGQRALRRVGRGSWIVHLIKDAFGVRAEYLVREHKARIRPAGFAYGQRPPFGVGAVQVIAKVIVRLSGPVHGPETHCIQPMQDFMALGDQQRAGDRPGVQVAVQRLESNGGAVAVPATIIRRRQNLKRDAHPNRL